MLRVRQSRWLLRRDAALLACFLCVMAASEGLSTEARLELSMILEETSLRIVYVTASARLAQRVKSIEKLKREESKIINNFRPKDSFELFRVEWNLYFQIV